MKLRKAIKIILSIITGEVVLVIATTVAQEVLFNGIGLKSPYSELLLGGLATFVAAVLAGFAARIILNQPHPIVAIVMSLLIAIETSYLAIAEKTADPVWFDLLAGTTLIIGVWLGFNTLSLVEKFKK